MHKLLKVVSVSLNSVCTTLLLQPLQLLTQFIDTLYRVPSAISEITLDQYSCILLYVFDTDKISHV